MTFPKGTDAQIVKRARETGVGGPEYRYLRDALREIGVGTLTNLSKRSKLFLEVRRKNIRIPTPPPPDYPYHARSIIHLAVEIALRRFMKNQVMGGRWNPKKGAGLGTFFVNAAICAFAEEYSRFYAEEISVNEIPTEDLSDHTEHQTSRQQDDPAKTAADRDLITRLLPPEISNDIKLMFLRSASGYTQSEIAAELGTSADAVSSAMRRYRRRIQQIRNDD